MSRYLVIAQVVKANTIKRTVPLMVFQKRGKGGVKKGLSGDAEPLWGL